MNLDPKLVLSELLAVEILLLVPIRKLPHNLATKYGLFHASFDSKKVLIGNWYHLPLSEVNIILW